MAFPSSDDPCWQQDTNAYRQPYDVWPLVAARQHDVTDAATWDLVWREL